MAAQPSTPLRQTRWLNLSALGVILAMIVGIFFWPGPEGVPVVTAFTPQRTLNFEVLILGINDLALEESFQPGATLQLSIDDSPHTPVEIQSVELLPRTVPVTQPDGSLNAQLEPRPEMNYGQNVLLTLTGTGFSTHRGAVLGRHSLRMGKTVELEGPRFNTKGSVLEINVEE